MLLKLIKKMNVGVLRLMLLSAAVGFLKLLWKRLRWLMDQWWCSDGKIEGPGIRKSSKAFSRQTPHHLILAPQRGAHSSKPLLDHNKTTQDHYYTTTRQPLKISAVLHAIIYQLRFQSLVQGGRSWNDLEQGPTFYFDYALGLGCLIDGCVWRGTKRIIHCSSFWQLSILQMLLKSTWTELN